LPYLKEMEWITPGVKGKKYSIKTESLGNFVGGEENT